MLQNISGPNGEDFTRYLADIYYSALLKFDGDLFFIRSPTSKAVSVLDFTLFGGTLNCKHTRLGEW